jgi:hypothetical protein
MSDGGLCYACAVPSACPATAGPKAVWRDAASGRHVVRSFPTRPRVLRGRWDGVSDIASGARRDCCARAMGAAAVELRRGFGGAGAESTTDGIRIMRQVPPGAVSKVPSPPNATTLSTGSTCLKLERQAEDCSSNDHPSRAPSHAAVRREGGPGRVPAAGAGGRGAARLWAVQVRAARGAAAAAAAGQDMEEDCEFDQLLRSFAESPPPEGHEEVDDACQARGRAAASGEAAARRHAAARYAAAQRPVLSGGTALLV